MFFWQKTKKQSVMRAVNPTEKKNWTTTFAMMKWQQFHVKQSW